MKLLTKLRCRAAMWLMPKGMLACSGEWARPAPSGMVSVILGDGGGKGGGKGGARPPHAQDATTA